MASRSIPLLFILSFIVVAVARPPKKCKFLECPTYKLIEQGNGSEIRRYNPSIWVSNAPIKGNSVGMASAIGYNQLHRYINGANEEKKRLKMTDPALMTVAKEVKGAKSEFTTLFYVPKENQPDPPKAEGIRVKEKVEPTYVAVRQFGWYVTDENVEREVKALRAALNGTKWGDAIQKNRRPQDYVVAQYDGPIEVRPDRLNEIWIPFSWSL